LETDIETLGDTKMALENVVTFPSAEETGLDHLGITIDRTRDKDLSEQAYKLLKDYYCNKDEDSPQQAYARAAVAYSGGDLELAQRIYRMHLAKARKQKLFLFHVF
jgi:ribonucleotide reductase alpha subunit